MIVTKSSTSILRTAAILATGAAALLAVLRAAAILATGTAALLAIRSIGALPVSEMDLDGFVAQVVLRLAVVTLALSSLVLCTVPRLGLLAMASGSREDGVCPDQCEREALRPVPTGRTF